MELLKKNPGITATNMAKLMWPHLRNGVDGMKPVLLAALHLRMMKNRGLVRIKYSGDPFKERAWCIYYLTDYGYEICEYYRKLQN